jgi:hypothetical protein
MSKIEPTLQRHHSAADALSRSAVAMGRAMC